MSTILHIREILSTIGLSWDEFMAYPDKVEERKGDTFMIPLIDQAFSAGKGQFLQDYDEVSEYISVPKELQRLGKNNLRAAYVRGDSMEPTFHDGDRFICDTLGYDGADGVYAIHYQGKSYIKRLQKIFTEGIKVMSDNPKYDPFMVTSESDEFFVIGRVHCALHMI